MNSIRVRYAPSPTGLQHLGGLRTALFNWLYARQNKGAFIVRFEDTDRGRLVKEAEQYIEDSLKWLGLEWDEGADKGGDFGPYRQSERLEIYQEYSQNLVEKGRIYRDWTSPADLEDLRRQAQANKSPLVIRQDMLQTAGDINKPHVQRFKIDESLVVKWEDQVFGKLTFDSKTIDDFVAIKSDGFPTYNFANVIDDHSMRITHVLRGNEYISSTPKYLQVYAAMEWQPPQSIHLPQVLGPDKAKLSKRHGAKPALEYQAEGYLPEAVINFLATLGWNDGTEQEVFTRQDLIKKFNPSRIQKSPAIFDKDRLDWLNGQHIRNLSLDELMAAAKQFWPVQAKIASEGRRRVMEVERQRIKKLSQLKELPDYFFRFEPPLNLTEIRESFNKDGADIELKAWLREVVVLIQSQDIASKNSLMDELKERVQTHGGKASALFSVVRIILCNSKTKTPPVWEVIYALGKPESTRRLELILAML